MAIAAPLDLEQEEYTVVNTSKQALIVQAGVWGRGHDAKLESFVVLRPGEERKWKPFLSARKDVLAQDALNEQILKRRQPFAEYVFHVFEFENDGAGDYFGNLRDLGRSKAAKSDEQGNRVEIGSHLKKPVKANQDKDAEGTETSRKVVLTAIRSKTSGGLTGTQIVTTGIDYDKHKKDLVYCTFRYSNRPLPSPEEMARFERISQRIDGLERREDFVQVGVIMIDGKRDYMMYTTYGKELVARLRAELAPFQPELETMPDPDWDQYRDLVDMVDGK